MQSRKFFSFLDVTLLGENQLEKGFSFRVFMIKNSFVKFDYKHSDFNIYHEFDF